MQPTRSSDNHTQFASPIAQRIDDVSKYQSNSKYDNSETTIIANDISEASDGPSFQYSELYGIPFPGLPQLHLSATHLVYLKLLYPSFRVYFTKSDRHSHLRVVQPEFQSPQSRPDRETRPPPPSKHLVIPALIFTHIKGVIEYLEDLVTCTDILDSMTSE